LGAKSKKAPSEKLFCDFLESPDHWVFYLNILEKRTVGAAAGKAGDGQRAVFFVWRLTQMPPALRRGI